MKNLLILAASAVLATAAFAQQERNLRNADHSTGVLPELVVTAPRIAGDVSAGVLPEFVVIARRPVGDASVGVLPEFVVTARRLPAAVDSPRNLSTSPLRRVQVPARAPKSETPVATLAATESAPIPTSNL